MKRYLAAAIAALSLVPGAVAQRAMVIPASLQLGDSVAIISPASHPNPADIDSACVAISNWGYVPVRGRYVTGKLGTFAGTIEERLSDLRWAFESPGIKAIICGRGGYGCVQLLCELPDGYFARHPKWLAGYSDISALHAALTTQSVMSIHSHMCGPIGHNGGSDSLSLMLRSILEGRYPGYSVAPHKLNHCGIATGTLIGGNLAVLNDLAGSRYDITKIDGAILFLEDVNESHEALSRALYRLKCAGVLGRLRGIIFGQFTHARHNLHYSSTEEMIAEIVRGYDIPVCYNFPVGHVDNNVPLIEGAPVTLTVAPKGVTLSYHIR